MKRNLLSCVAGSVLLTGLGTSVAFAGGDGRDLGGYGPDSYQPIAEAPRQYEESPDILSFGIQPEPAPVVAEAEPEPEPEPEPPFTVAMGGINDLDSPCAIDQTEEDSPHLKADIDGVIAAPEDEVSAGCGERVDVADLDKGIDYTIGGPPGGDGPASILALGVVSVNDPSEIDSVLSTSVGDPGPDSTANRPGLLEVTVGDNFLFGETGQSDPINVTVLDAINGDGSAAAPGGTTGTDLDQAADPVITTTGEPGIAWADLSGQPFTAEDETFTGIVEINIGDDPDPDDSNIVLVDVFSNSLTGGQGTSIAIDVPDDSGSGGGGGGGAPGLPSELDPATLEALLTSGGSGGGGTTGTPLDAALDPIAAALAGGGGTGGTTGTPLDAAIDPVRGALGI